MRLAVGLSLLISCLLGWPTLAEEKFRIWRTDYTPEPGNSRCYRGSVDVWESAQTFSLHLENSNWEIWSMHLAADGSAERELKAQGISPSDKPLVRVTIPAGRGPRTFQIVNLTLSCRYTMVPGDCIK